MSRLNVARKYLRLLHTSDLHIGSDTYQEDAYQGLEAVLKCSVEVGADAVLVAGDLFDHSRVPESTVHGVISLLDSLGKPVVVLPGNHDTVLMNGVDFDANAKNVLIMKEADGEMVMLPELGLALWGRPVYNHVPEFRPMEGLPSRPWSGWYVSLAHGMFMDPHADAFRSSPITAEEIELAPCDYIALGHVHAFRKVSDNGIPAYYCGAPSGSRRKTAALVELHPEDGVRVQRIEL